MKRVWTVRTKLLPEHFWLRQWNSLTLIVIERMRMLSKLQTLELCTPSSEFGQLAQSDEEQLFRLICIFTSDLVVFFRKFGRFNCGRLIHCLWKSKIWIPNIGWNSVWQAWCVRVLKIGSCQIGGFSFIRVCFSGFQQICKTIDQLVIPGDSDGHYQPSNMRK